MKIILKKDYTQLGKKGEVKEVADGYARNFLIPREIALAAKKGNIKIIQEALVKLKKEENLLLEKLGGKKAEFENLVLELSLKSDKTGKLFGSVKITDIQKELLRKLNVKIPKDKIRIKAPIKEIGEYEVLVKVSDLESKIKLQVKKEKESKK